MQDKNIKKLERLAKIADKGEIAIIEELDAISEQFESVESQIQEVLSIAEEANNKPLLKGDKGDTPIKGKDYFTNTEVAQFKKEVTPVKGKDYFDGENGYTPIKDVDYFDGKTPTEKELQELIKPLIPPAKEAKQTIVGWGAHPLRVEQSGVVKTKTARNLNFIGATVEQKKNGTTDITITGGGAVDSVNGQTGVVVLDTDDIADTATNRYTNDTDITKLAGIEAGAEVNTIDTVTDSSEIDFTITARDLTASLKAGSIDKSKLDVSTNASLDLADSALQSGDNITELVNNAGYTTNTGTVTSVAVSGSDGIEVDSGSPVTTTGTIALGVNKTSMLSHLNVEDGADVTDATNVNAAGAVMNSDYTPAHSILVQQSGTGSPTALQVANNTLLGRLSGGGSDIDSLTATEVRTLLNVEDGAEVNNISDTNATDLTDGGDTTLHYHSSDRDRANHTGTQTASTISDFDTEVSNNTDVAANTTARHAALTVTDSSEIDFTLTGQDLTASLKSASVDETKLDASVNASLDLADSSLQPANISDTAYDATSWNGVTTIAPSKNAVRDKIDAMDSTIAGKQDTLVSGTNIKTINSNSLLGSGDLSIPALTDGDKGDITVSASGTVWDIDNNAVTLAKMASINSNKLLGRITAGGGIVEEVDFSDIGQAILANTTALQVRTTIDAQEDLSGASLFTTTIAVDDKILIQDTSGSDGLKTVTPQNVLDLMTFTDTDDIDFTRSTNAVSAVLKATAISAKTSVTAAATDTVLIGDASDSNNLKKTTAQDIANLGTGNLLQIKYSTKNTQTTTVANIPYDASIPQQTEGAEWDTITITPISATSLLEIEFSATVSLSELGGVVGALFKDSTANALSANAVIIQANNYTAALNIKHYEISSSTSSRTYKIRWGVSGGTGYINRRANEASFGGVQATAFTIREYKQ